MPKTKLCINCFKDIDTTIGGGEICPHCGSLNNNEKLNFALDHYTVIAHKYLIGKVISANSEGLTYSAFDQHSHKRVRVREFYPATICYRDGTHVFPSDEDILSFKRHYEEFLTLAGDLPKLNGLPGFAPVVDTLWENNTCYIVYEYIESITLKAFVDDNGGKLDFNTTYDLFIPLINSLSRMHSLGINHLGISPQTLRVCKDGKMRLFEFSIEAVRRVGTDLEVDLVTGCAAYEQYTKIMQCSEAADVYAFSATMLYAFSGHLPSGADKRVNNSRLLISRDVLKSIPPYITTALAGALQVRPEERIASFDNLRVELSSDSNVSIQSREPEVIRTIPQKYTRTNKPKRIMSPALWLITSFVFTAGILYLVATYLIDQNAFSSESVLAFFGQTLNLTEDTVDVPDMVTDYYSDWSKRLESTEYQFTIAVVSQEFSDEYPDGVILEQTPEAGSPIEIDGVVQLVVSRGSSIRVLPEIVGIEFAQALQALEAEGFIVVKEEVNNADVTNGSVIGYANELTSTSQMEYGSTVTVIVSKGP